MLPESLLHAGTMPGWHAPLAWLLLKATLMLIAALGITLAMQRASAGARHLVWLGTLGTLLLVPALTAWAPLRLRILPARPSAAAMDAAPLGAGPWVEPSRSTATTPHAPATLAASASVARDEVGDGPALPRQASPLSIVLAIWAAVALAIGASLGYASLAVRGIVRRASAIETPDWLAPLWDVSDRLGLDEPPRLLRSADAAMPFACGVVHPTIVLPAACDGWSLDRRRAVLLHELAHVRRHDLAGHTLGRLTCALYWFHPLVWTAAKRLRAESERACDDLALACGTRATDYAEHLLDIVISVRRDGTPSVALAMARRTEFEGRMLAILDPELRRVAPSRRQSASLIISLAVISMIIGAAAPVPRELQAAARPVAEDAGIRPLPRGEQPAATSATNQRPIGRSMRSSAWTAPQTTRQTVQRTDTSIAVSLYRELRTVTERSTHPAIGDQAPALIGTIKSAPAHGGTSAKSGPDDERPALLAKVLRTDSSATLRRIAAWGLAEYAGTSVAAEALAAALRRDADASVREMAAWALAEGDDGNAAAAEALTAALRSDGTARVRMTAAWALGSIGGHGSADALSAALADESAEVRQRAVWALGNVQPKHAPAALVAMLGDRDPKMRELTAWALFNIEDPSAAPALEKAMRAEPNADLQMNYIRALAALGEQSVDAIRELLDSPDARIKSIAVRALAGGHATGPWPWPWPEPRPNP